MLRKLLGYVVIAFVVYYIIKNPAGAATTGKHIGAGMASAASSVGTFLGALLGGAR